MTLVSTNRELLERARRVMPGGVSSPVRAYSAVGGEPPFIVSAHGCRVTDADGREFVDLVSSWGALIAGHAHPAVIAAIEAQARRGTSYGAPSPLEVELAEEIAASVASVEMVRFVSSGTEAVMSALRLARAATGRDAILKFAGSYHGHADALLSRAGSGLATLGLPERADGERCAYRERDGGGGAEQRNLTRTSAASPDSHHPRMLILINRGSAQGELSLGSHDNSTATY